MRIVSLLPSATEIIAELGALDELVGVSHECDYPPEVRDLPRLTSTPIDAGATSREIDDQVGSLLEAGLSLYDLDVEALVELAPDVVITQDACEVCAIDFAEVERALSQALPGASIVSIAPATLAQVYEQFVTIGTAIGRADAGRAAASAMAEEMQGWGLRVPPATEGVKRPAVYCIEWLDPLMVAGHWVPELVELAGGSYPWLESGARSEFVTWDDLTAADPDQIIVSPCGWDMITTYQGLEEIEADHRWQALKAVRDGAFLVIDGNAYMNRSGPRLVETLKIMIQHLWPGLDSAEANDQRARDMLEQETRMSPSFDESSS